ncbi:MAG: hypothetical protein V7L22_21360 [Nostoc sp.]|uniref:hypothetical protein n=1 Tax=Nostoc sp. TaxID=1180 RepID=UPI002FFC0A88
MEDFSYLWNGQKPDWALLKFYASPSEKELRYLIVNTKTKRALLAHNDTLYQHLKQTMLEKKVRIVSDL